MRNKLIAFGILIAQLGVTPLQVHAANFKDVPADYIYADAIQTLKDRGIVRGYDGISFGPDNLITRAELLKIALEGAAVDTSAWSTTSSPFPDVTSKNSLRQYVIYAKERGIVSGYSDGTYKPDQSTTRAEAIKMLLNINAVATGAVLTSPYQDLEIDDPLAPYVVTAREKKIIPGKYTAKILGTGEAIKRGEVAEMMYRLLYLREQNEITYPEKAPPVKIIEGNHSVTVFKQMTIQTPIAKTMVANSYYPVTVASSQSTIKVIVQRDLGDQSVWEYKIDDGKATFDLYFPESGQYHIAFVADGSAESPSIPVAVVDSWQVGEDEQIDALAGAQFSIDADGHTWLMWSGSQNRTVFQLTCEQGRQEAERTIVSSGNKWKVDYHMFTDFEEGEIDCSLTQALAASHLATLQDFSKPYRWSFNALVHHFRTWDKANLSINGALPMFTTATTLELNGLANIPLSNYAEIILPSGNVQVFSFQAGENDVLNSGIPWELNVQLADDGIYFLEINDTQGLAVLNTPIYRVEGVPILPDFIAAQEGRVVTNKKPLTNTERTAMIQDLVRRVNDLRAKLNRAPVALNADLSRFAQAHADDMIAKDYFSHKDKNGKGPDQRKLAFDIALPVGENIAFSIDLHSIDEGLKRSAVHRLNLLDQRWAQVGIGLARSPDGFLYAVQEFSPRSFISQPITEEEREDIAEKTLVRINTNRAAVNLPPLVLGSEYRDALATWEENPRAQTLRALLLDAGMTLGRILSSEGSYSPNLPAELALQAAVTDTTVSKMDMGITFEGETMLVAVVLY